MTAISKRVKYWNIPSEVVTGGGSLRQRRHWSVGASGHRIQVLVGILLAPAHSAAPKCRSIWYGVLSSVFGLSFAFDGPALGSCSVDPVSAEEILASHPSKLRTEISNHINSPVMIYLPPTVSQHHTTSFHVFMFVLKWKIDEEIVHYLRNTPYVAFVFHG